MPPDQRHTPDLTIARDCKTLMQSGLGSESYPACQQGKANVSYG